MIFFFLVHPSQGIKNNGSVEYLARGQGSNPQPVPPSQCLAITRPNEPPF